MAKKRPVKFTKILSTLATIIMALLVVRVVDLQGFRGELFRQISEENRQFRVNIPAERGVFLDRYDQPLVVNTRSYYRYADIRAVYSDVVPLAQPEALQIQVSDPLAVGYDLRRQYTNPFSTAHVLGYASVVNPADLTADNSLGITDVVGRLGLERSYDDLLRGQDGYQEFEVNALGEKQAVQAKKEPTVGRPLNTTLDSALATVAWRAMGGNTGAVVILDAETGAVLALISLPSFNSNLFTPKLDSNQDRQRLAQLQEALADERQLFFNRAISGTYPPGSVFKLITAVAGLESGAFDLESTVDDRGILEVGEYRFANWYYTQYGRTEGVISLIRAITRSNDTFFYKAAEWTGVEALVAKAREFGFGEPTGIEIPGEAAGLVPDPAWKEQTFGERWFLGNTYHLGIGQGDLLVTPLQLAQMMAVFGNGGKLCQPHVVAKEHKSSSLVECSSLGMSKRTLAAIQQGMIGACSSGGTAFPFFDWNDSRLAQLPEELSASEQLNRGVVACKTGTAEFGAEDEQGYRQTHAWFGMTVGGLRQLLAADLASGEDLTVSVSTQSALTDEREFDLSAKRTRWLEQIKEFGFPNKLAIMVLVESNEEQPFAEGSREAAPIAREIFDWIVGNNLD
jgi:penicillin-binding protein 2